MEKATNQKTKIRSQDEKIKLEKRLNVIEGQIRGIKQMIEDNRYCGDILIQLSAVSKSLQSIGDTILKKHMRTCVVEDLKNDKLEIIDEVIELMKRLN